MYPSVKETIENVWKWEGPLKKNLEGEGTFCLLQTDQSDFLLPVNRGFQEGQHYQPHYHRVASREASRRLTKL